MSEGPSTANQEIILWGDENGKDKSCKFHLVDGLFIPSSLEWAKNFPFLTVEARYFKNCFCVTLYFLLSTYHFSTYDVKLFSRFLVSLCQEIDKLNPDKPPPAEHNKYEELVQYLNQPQYKFEEFRRLTYQCGADYFEKFYTQEGLRHPPSLIQNFDIDAPAGQRCVECESKYLLKGDLVFSQKAEATLNQLKMSVLMDTWEQLRPLDSQYSLTEPKLKKRFLRDGIWRLCFEATCSSKKLNFPAIFWYSILLPNEDTRENSHCIAYATAKLLNKDSGMPAEAVKFHYCFLYKEPVSMLRMRAVVTYPPNTTFDPNKKLNVFNIFEDVTKNSFEFHLKKRKLEDEREKNADIVGLNRENIPLTDPTEKDQGKGDTMELKPEKTTPVLVLKEPFSIIGCFLGLIAFIFAFWYLSIQKDTFHGLSSYHRTLIDSFDLEPQDTA